METILSLVAEPLNYELVGLFAVGSLILGFAFALEAQGFTQTTRISALAAAVAVSAAMMTPVASLIRPASDQLLETVSACEQLVLNREVGIHAVINVRDVYRARSECRNDSDTQSVIDRQAEALQRAEAARAKRDNQGAKDE